MALLELLLMAAWTALIVRLFAGRGTLSARTLLAFAALGALMAVTAAPLAEKFIVPYPLGDYGHPFLNEVLRVAMRNMVLLSPVITYLFFQRNFRLTSIADAFLLAFALGLGFELVGGVLAAGAKGAALKGFTLFPPWQFTWSAQPTDVILGFRGDFALAGVAWAMGLICLTLAAMLRFARKRRYAIPVTLAVFALVTLHEAVWTYQLATFGPYRPEQGFLKLFDTVMLHGLFFAAVCLLALLTLSVMEGRWAANSRGERPPSVRDLLVDFVDACHRRGRGFLAGGPAGWAFESHRDRLRAQMGYAQAEVRHMVRRNELFQSERMLELRLEELERLAAAPKPRRAPWFLWIDVWLASAAVAVIVLGLSRLPQTWGPMVWNTLLLNLMLPVLKLTVLQIILIVLLLGWFVMRPDRPPGRTEPDLKLRFNGESALSFAAMGAALLVLFHVPLDRYYPPFSSIAFINRAGFPSLDPAQLASFMLLLAAVSGWATRGATLAWRARATADERHAGRVRNGLLILNAAVLLWLSIKVYSTLLAALQSKLGPKFFTIFGRLGNVVMAVMTTLILFALSIAVGLIMQRITRALEQMLIGDRKPGETARVVHAAD